MSHYFHLFYWMWSKHQTRYFHRTTTFEMDHNTDSSRVYYFHQYTCNRLGGHYSEISPFLWRWAVSNHSASSFHQERLPRCKFLFRLKEFCRLVDLYYYWKILYPLVGLSLNGSLGFSSMGNVGSLSFGDSNKIILDLLPDCTRVKIMTAHVFPLSNLESGNFHRNNMLSANRTTLLDFILPMFICQYLRLFHNKCGFV